MARSLGSRVLYDLDPQWVADRIPLVDDFGPCVALGVVSGERILAGVVYHDFQSKFATIQVSIAADSPMWARPRIIKELLAYPFYQARVNVVWSATPISNNLAIKVNKHLGFKKEAILEHRFGWNEHAYMARMTVGEYRTLYEVDNG